MSSDLLKYCGTIVLMLPFLFGLEAQTNSHVTDANQIALYAPESTFSLSLIEQKLYSLVDEKGNRLFKERDILNVNDMLAAKQNQKAEFKAMKELLNLRSGDYSEELIGFIKKLRSRIRKYDRFLQVNTKNFQGLIEYQFILYPVKKGTAAKGLTDKYSQVLDVQKKSFSTRLLRVNEDISSIEREIENALKELFPKSHLIPKAKISVVEDKRNTLDTIAVIVNNVLQLDAFYTIDEDTPVGLLKYEWKKLRKVGARPDEDLKVQGTGMTCQVTPNKAGIFQVELKVIDGVFGKTSKLTRDTLTVIAYDKPDITIAPSSLQSYYVRNLLINEGRFKNRDKIRIVSYNGSGKPEITTEDKKITFNLKETPEKERRGHSMTDTILLGMVEYENVKTNGTFQLKSSFPNGVSTALDLKVSHKIYYPYYFDLSWTHNDIEVDTALGISKDVQAWDEPKFGVNFKVSQKVHIGLGGILKKAVWEKKDGSIYKLTSFGEINVTYDFFQKKNARMGLTAFGKIYQIEEPKRDYSQLVAGMRGQISINMFQGLSEAFLNVTLLSKPISGNFLTKYTEWWGIGFRIFIPN